MPRDGRTAPRGCRKLLAVRVGTGDATVVRALLVPSTMRLLGHWNWWMPARLERFVGGHLPASEAEAEAAVAR